MTLFVQEPATLSVGDGLAALCRQEPLLADRTSGAKVGVMPWKGQAAET